MGSGGDPHDGSSSNSSGGASAPTGQDYHKMQVVDAGAAGVEVVKPATVCSTRDGSVIDLPKETVRAVDEFIVPAGYRREGSREKSFMYSLGVYVKPVDLKDDTVPKFFCLASPSCRKSKRIVKCSGGDRSNVNTHIKKAHNMCGAQGVTKSDKKKEKQTTIIEKSIVASDTSCIETNRVRELMALRMVVEQFLPFTFFSSGTAWEELMGVLTSTTTAFPTISARRVKHLILEVYIATKEAVVGNMLNEARKAALPILHYGLDIWTCKVSGRKFLAICGCYVDSNFTLRNVLFSVKHYAPVAEIQETEKASEVLFTIFKATLAEYGVRVSDLAGGTSRSGSDIKAMCTNILNGRHNIPWDWCVCHLADKAAEKAFGTSGDPQKSSNSDAREILQLVIKIAANVHQSTRCKQMFDELQLEMLEEVFKISKHAPEQWLNLVRTFERIIRLWHVLRNLHVDNGEQFPLDAKKDVFLQLFSLLEPLTAIICDGQFGDVPMTAEVYMAFALLHSEVLNPAMPLEVFDIPPAPGSPKAEKLPEETGFAEKGKAEENEKEENQKKKPLPSKKIPPEQLHPITVRTRKELRKALVKMFVGRVWDKDSADPSPFRDATVLLTPPYNTGKFFLGLRLSEEDAEFLADDKRQLAPTTDSDLANQVSNSWDDIQTRALAAAKVEDKRKSSAVSYGAKPLKRFCTAGAGSNTERRQRFASFGRPATVGGARERNGDGDSDQNVLEDVVKEEIIRYQASSMQTSELDCRDVLRWWGTTGKVKFPYLAPVAQQAFGNQASASQIKPDFSACGNLLGSKRSRADTYWVEMVMFLKANYELMPELKNIPVIAAEDIRARIPARFTGKDANLVAAEAGFDFLDNMQNPTVDGLDLDI